MSTTPTRRLAKLGLAVAATGIAVSGALVSASGANAQPTPCNGTDINCVYVPYTCNYDVLCDAAGNVTQGPPLGSGGIRLGNGQICEANGCTRPES